MKERHEPSPARAGLASERSSCLSGILQIPITMIVSFITPAVDMGPSVTSPRTHPPCLPYRAATPAKSIPRKPAPRAVEPWTTAAPAVDVDAAEAEEAVPVEEVLDREEVVDEDV